MKRRLQFVTRSSFALPSLSFRSSPSLAPPARGRLFMSSVMKTRVHLPRTGDGLYVAGAKLDLMFQARDRSAFEPLSVQVMKCFKPSTSAVVLLVRRLSDSQPFILKLADRRLGYRYNWDVDIPWTSTVEAHLRHAVHDIQLGVTPNWFEIVQDTSHPQRPGKDEWEDWMWEIFTWTSKMNDHDTELSAYRLLHRLQGSCIPRLYGVVHLSITSYPTPLHPITDIVQGLALEYVPGTNMEDLTPGINVSRQKAEAVSSRVMDAFRIIQAENCVIHNDLHIGNVILRKEDMSPVIIDFGRAIIRKHGWSDEEWIGVVEGGPDTRNMRRALADPKTGVWKRNITPFERSDSRYENPMVFIKYVESLPEDYRHATFERVLIEDCDEAQETAYRWEIRPGVRCRLWYD